MHFLSLKSKIFWHENIRFSLVVTGLLGSFASISGISLLDFFNKSSICFRTIFLFIIFAVFIILISLVKIIYISFSFRIKIREMIIYIKHGDIFKAKGKKLIPFNEYFDLIVDDVIVSRNTLHGTFIEKCVPDIDELKQKIENADETVTKLKKYEKNNRTAYPLGRVISYNDFLLLSFTEFNIQNEAHLTKSKLENCLKNMWIEICRIYAFYPICLPLLGSGITRIDDWLERTEIDLLKFMLYTLYFSNVDIRKPITIYLTKEKYNNLNIYELKGVKL